MSEATQEERWQPLSRRRKGLKPNGPYEGVPEHMRALLKEWYNTASKNASGNNQLQLMIAAALERPEHSGGSMAAKRELLAWAEVNEDNFLDLIDAMLRFHPKRGVYSPDLTDILDHCASV
ncbi:hypothetical protein, partial [Gordonia aichiensis]